MYVCVSDGPEVTDSGELPCRCWTQVSVLNHSSQLLLVFFFFFFFLALIFGALAVLELDQSTRVAKLKRSTCLYSPSVRCAPAAPPGWLFLKCTQKSLNSKMLYFIFSVGPSRTPPPNFEHFYWGGINMLPVTPEDTVQSFTAVFSINPYRRERTKNLYISNLLKLLHKPNIWLLTCQCLPNLL